MSLADDGVRPLFRAVVTTVVPEARDLSDASWTELEQIVDRALSERPRSVRRQVRAFLRLLDVVARLTRGHGFVHLDDAQRTRLLERLGASRLLLLPRGVWGVRTLAFMGYYARPDAAREIGYRASVDGWRARPDDRPSAPERAAGLHG